MILFLFYFILYSLNILLKRMGRERLLKYTTDIKTIEKFY